MLVVKYHKTPQSQYISHIDLLRQITRLIRRCKINMNYSQGFHPHMIIKMSAPCPLGITSKAEYVTIDCNYNNLNELEENLKKSARPFLEIEKVWEVEKNPNFAGKVYSSDYIVETDGCDKILEILKQKEILISYKSKKKIREINAKDYIYGYEIVDNGIIFRLGLGNKTLRIDRLVNYFNDNSNLDIDISKIVRIKQYFNINNKEIEFDEFLKRQK